MLQVFKREMRANLKNLLFWALGLLALAAIGYLEFSGMAEAGDIVNAVFIIMPRVVRVAFGMDVLPLNTAAGYYACMYTFVGLGVFTHAALLGAQLIAKEETGKTADFLFVRPLKRTAVIAGKLLAGVAQVLVLNLVVMAATLGSFLPQLKGEPFTKEVLLSMVGMFLAALVFLAGGALLAALSKRPRKSASLATGFLLVAYLLMVTVEMAELPALDFVTPFRYFHTVSVIQQGLRPAFVALALVLFCALGTVTAKVYEKRNLHG